LTSLRSEGGTRLHLVRHGETEWARLGRHTGLTDVPLTETGRAQASAIAARLRGLPFRLVLSSPLARALETARLAGYGDVLEIEPDLREWEYGDYEGLTTPEIRERVPGWTVWSHPVPGGEPSGTVASRVDRVIDRVRAEDGDVAVFAHGHILRVLASRWLGLPPSAGRHLALSTATVSVLGWERDTPVIEHWNEGCHLP
jgi:broad specificity phosphatase PhoE